METVIIIWLAGSVIVGIIAGSRGRSGVGYCILSMVLSPLLGLILAVALPSLKQASGAAAAQPSPQTHVRCGQCAEFILPEAAVCKHCGAAHQPDTAFHGRIAAQKQDTERTDSKNLLIGMAFIVGLIVLANIISRW